MATAPMSQRRDHTLRSVLVLVSVLTIIEGFAVGHGMNSGWPTLVLGPLLLILTGLIFRRWIRDRR